jgi:hypothetical protein
MMQKIISLLHIYPLIIHIATFALGALVGLGLGAGLAIARGKGKGKKGEGKEKGQEKNQKNQAKEIDNDWSRWARSDPAKIQW